MKQTGLLLRLGCCAVACLLTLAGARALAENIDPDNDNSQFAWGENIGWVNAESGGDGGPGVQVEDDGLSGYMWGENIGWISLHCLNEASCGTVDYGVLNDGAGNLSGLAWGENIGWVNFSPATGGRVTIDPSTGEFSGRAWSENTGWISFRNTTGSVTYGVTTSWDPGPLVTDIDGDGIVDALDTDEATFSNQFSDVGLGGSTTGIITARGDQVLSITEGSNPAGVRIAAAPTGGAAHATISACGGTATLTVSPGDEVVVTCSSVTITVISGDGVAVQFTVGDEPATMDIGAGNSVTFDPTDNTVTAPATNVDTLVVLVDGREFAVPPGQTTVVDTNAPTIEDVSASPNVLWPPNHKMVPAQVAISVTDDLDPVPTCQIVSVTSNESVDGTGSGDKTPDWEFSPGSLRLDLRAERAGGGTGRVYTLTIECTDGSGNTAMATVDVTVPHDQGAKPKKKAKKKKKK